MPKLAAGVVLTACLMWFTAPALASFPGRNGSIAFASLRHGSFDIYLVSPSGTLKRLTKTSRINETSPAWSANGRKIAFERRDFSHPNHPTPFEIWVMNADGSHRHRLARGTEPAWSPNGKRIAFVGPRQPRVGRPDIWVMNADGSHRKRLTSDPFSERSPDWSPDGKWIAFASDRGHSHDIWKMHANGSGGVRLTAVGPYDDQPSWSPSGKQIAFISRSTTGLFHLWTMDADGSHAAPVGDVTAHGIAWSPDGRQIAIDHSAATAGTANIFRVPLASPQPVALTSGSAPDSHPSWQSR
jgi:Tol biopolymer transport system component